MEKYLTPDTGRGAENRRDIFVTEFRQDSFNPSDPLTEAAKTLVKVQYLGKFKLASD